MLYQVFYIRDNGIVAHIGTPIFETVTNLAWFKSCQLNSLMISIGYIIHIIRIMYRNRTYTNYYTVSNRYTANTDLVTKIVTGTILAPP